MAKAILISVRPQWVCKIVDDKTKKDEIRKGSSLYKAINKLIEEQGVAPMLIYCTKEYQGSKHVPTYYLNGKIVAQFNATADLLELRMILGGLYFTRAEYEYEDCFDPKLNDFHENAQMDNRQLLHYTGEKLGTKITDIHINDLEIFDKPKELSEFKRCTEKTCIYGKCHKYMHCLKPLTKAPQSFCYIEVEELL